MQYAGHKLLYETENSRKVTWFRINFILHIVT